MCLASWKLIQLNLSRILKTAAVPLFFLCCSADPASGTKFTAADPKGAKEQLGSGDSPCYSSGQAAKHQAVSTHVEQLRAEDVQG